MLDDHAILGADANTDTVPSPPGDVATECGLAAIAELPSFIEAAYFLWMKPVPPTNAELRVRLAPLRTWLALSVSGFAITLARNGLYGITIVPIRPGATPFIVLTLVGAIYAGSVLVWLMVRRRGVR